MGFDMQKMLKQAQQMQEQLNSVQEQLGTEEVTGSAGGGAVTVTCDGRGEVKGVKIQPDAAQDVEALEDLVLMAIRDAHTKANQLAQQKMAGVTQGLNIPGLPF
ncbi:MAG: YbaB/EbfC family nucleoid-associated protein [Cyanobacteria bacterium HKST-UBA04]|nr:YbaB/EbfC family nucleoid-associated protein [Cyanobacteria bacterium HKST-UBA05]MCA9799259.1 YbaB/EbfC family nucleoid-associated protein [Cyanobacteria bacterium HKST-UBA04]MCA9841229.1 YbaB/EbfC family nucleoid-associated protein [Cyanobacteria bacterium HKST-UBA03]